MRAPSADRWRSAPPHRLIGAQRIELRQEGRIVGEHARAFGRGGTVYDPWHYVPVLARKPGALRNGAPFKDWELPASIQSIRRKLKAAPDGDRRMVRILGAARERRAARRGGRLRGSVGAGRALRRRHAEHPRQQPRHRPAADDRHARGAAAAAPARR